MARHYSTRDFFRQMPNSLLARYFHAHGVFGDLDFAAMKGTQPDELFAAWLGLADTQHHEMDAELRDISELSCEKGFRAIIDEAAWHFANDPETHTAFVEQLATLANHFERAMTTFLDHHDFWKGAALFYHADSLPYWRKRTHLRTCQQRSTTRACANSPPASAPSSTVRMAEARTASWNRSAAARWTISSPTPRTTRSTASNGWTGSSHDGRTTQRSR